MHIYDIQFLKELIYIRSEYDISEYNGRRIIPTACDSLYSLSCSVALSLVDMVMLVSKTI